MASTNARAATTDVETLSIPGNTEPYAGRS